MTSTRASIPLLVTLAALQLGDVATTMAALSAGAGVEANPLMAWLQAEFGGAWCVGKLALAGLGLAALYRTGRRWQIGGLVLLYAWIVADNAVLLP